MRDDIIIQLSEGPQNAEKKREASPCAGAHAPEDRYSRLRGISWWEQERLRSAKVMVVGAGALGNEILKNLALLGIGNIFIIDMDRIEQSNLSRSVLYRSGDEGREKATVAAARVMELNPDVNATAFVGNALYDLGLGAFRAADLVLGGLDSREARLGINMACWKVNRPWVDGAIEVCNGIARVFVPPDGACYECTMNETDHRLLRQRRSCALLSRGEMLSGKVPTTPTTASVIAGIQVQEAVKLLHGDRELPTLAGKGYYFNGMTHDSYVVSYPRKEDCCSHDTYEEIADMSFCADRTTLREALRHVRSRLGEQAVLELGREIVTEFRCARCGKAQRVMRPLGGVMEGQAVCAACHVPRAPVLMHQVTGAEDFLDMTLAEVGIPAFDILAGRLGLNLYYFELSGDREKVLGRWAGEARK